MLAKPEKASFVQMAMTLFLCFFSTSYFTFGWIAAIAKSFGDIGAGNIIGVGGSIGAVCVAGLLTILVSIRRPLNSAARWPLLCIILLQFSVIWAIESGNFDGEYSSLVVYFVCTCHSILSSIVVTLECSRALKLSGTNFRLFRTFGSLGYASAALANQALAGEVWMSLAPLSILLVLLVRPRACDTPMNNIAPSPPHEKTVGKFVATREMWILFGISFLLAFCATPFQSFGVIELRKQAGGLCWLAVLIVAEIAFLVAFRIASLRFLLKSGGLIWAIAYWMLSASNAWGILGAVVLIALGCPMQTYVQAELHRCCEKSKWDATAQGMISVAASLGGFFCALFVSTWQTATPNDVWKGAVAMCLVVAPLIFVASWNRYLRG